MEKLMATLETKPGRLIAGAKNKSKNGLAKKLRGQQNVSKLIEVGQGVTPNLRMKR
jgi:hypothetical protein